MSRREREREWLLKYLTTMLDVTYLCCCCWVYCFNFVLDVVGVLVVNGRDIDGGVGPSGDSSTCRMPLLLADDDVPVRLLVSNERF